MIRSFSFGVKISPEAQTAPAFMDLNSFSFLHSSLCYAWMVVQLDPEWGSQRFVSLVQASFTMETLNAVRNTHPTCLHVYVYEVISYWRSILAMWVKGSGSIPSALSDGSYSVWNVQGHLWYTLLSEMAAVAKVTSIYLSASVTRTPTIILLRRGKTRRRNSGTQMKWVLVF